MVSANRVSPTGGEDVPKHRACDECRARKLACSKEPDGCARCVREGIPCHYSPQKPMGRPRKRPHVESAPEEEKGGGGGGGETAMPMALEKGDPMAMDVDLSFLDATAPSSLNFLDFLGPDFLSNAAVFPPPLPPQPPMLEQTKPIESYGGLWPFSGIGDIDFSGHGADAGTATTTTPVPSLDKVPSLSSPSADTPESQQSSSQPSQAEVRAACTVFSESKPCGCLASLYLALDSLQNLPQYVGPAMRVTRSAARVAHDTIKCPVCSPPDIVDPQTRPPIQSFQSLMILGALLPTIANGYNRILTMVDTEAAKADAERRQMAFSLEEYGGLWGRLGEVDVCGAVDAIDNRLLEPTMWRLTVRALLRLDVYGLGAKSASESSKCMGFVQIGLKDIITEMEQRSRARHAAIDAAVAAGLMPDPESHGHVKPPPGQQHNCLQIIEVAKRSIDHLIIA